MSEPLTERLVPPGIRKLSAYRAPAGIAPIKLDANESPWKPGPVLMRKLRRALEEVDPGRYPDPGSAALREAFARRHGIRPENVLVGNGSDELIALLLLTFRHAAAKGPPTVLVIEPTFAMYAISAAVAGYAVAPVYLDRGMRPQLESILQVVKKARPNITFVSNPNNPTGTLFEDRLVDAVVGATPGLVVVDEAYGDYSGTASRTTRVRDCPNLVVLRTLSKVGGAALRCGFLAAGEALVRELDKVRQPFNISAYSQAAALVLLENDDAVQEGVAEVVRERERLARGLVKAGVTVFPSAANFLMVTCRGRESRLSRFLHDGGVVVKSLPHLPVVGDALRITVGTPEQNDVVLAGARAFMEGQGHETR